MIGIFLYVTQAFQRVLAIGFRNNLLWFESHDRHISLCSPGISTRASSSLRKKYVGSCPMIGIFLYVAQADEDVLTVAFENDLFCSSPTTGIFLYAVQAVQRVLELGFGNKLRWFESHDLHISLYTESSSTRVSIILRK